jgi:hypothetical protein
MRQKARWSVIPEGRLDQYSGSRRLPSLPVLKNMLYAETHRALATGECIGADSTTLVSSAKPFCQGGGLEHWDIRRLARRLSAASSSLYIAYLGQLAQVVCEARVVTPRPYTIMETEDNLFWGGFIVQDLQYPPSVFRHPPIWVRAEVGPDAWRWLKFDHPDCQHDPAERSSIDGCLAVSARPKHFSSHPGSRKTWVSL